nr:MAG TPA: hypothetical protein [Caudoviricetes sp.]
MLCKNLHFRSDSLHTEKRKRDRFILKNFGYFLYDCIIMQRGD